MRQSSVVNLRAFRPGDWQQSASGLFLPVSYRRHYDRPVAIDLFSGAGGFSLGVMKGGFHVNAAVENDPYAVISYAYNLCSYPMRFHFDNDESEAKFTKMLEKVFKEKAQEVGADGVLAGFMAGQGWLSSQDNENGIPGCENIFFGDIRNFTGQQILEALGLQVGDVDLLIGSPPCQGFSRAGKRDIYDPRNSLVFEFARMVVEIRPKTICLENVPEMAKMIMPDGRSVTAAFAQALDDGGYAAHDAITQSLLYKNPNVRVAVREDFRRSEVGSKEEAGPEESVHQYEMFSD